MRLFTSPRERHFWFWAFMVFVAIYSTLFIGQPLAKLFGNQNIQAILFMIGVLLVFVVILVHGIRARPGKIEIAILLGILAVYGMFFLRLGLAERSHLIEYSILAIFIHKALTERVNNGRRVPIPAILSILLAFVIGLLDECIQIILPDRVFDPEDILFNGLAAGMAIGASMILNWGHRKIHKT